MFFFLSFADETRPVVRLREQPETVRVQDAPGCAAPEVMMRASMCWRHPVCVARSTGPSCFSQPIRRII